MGHSGAPPEMRPHFALRRDLEVDAPNFLEAAQVMGEPQHNLRGGAFRQRDIARPCRRESYGGRGDAPSISRCSRCAYDLGSEDAITVATSKAHLRVLSDGGDSVRTAPIRRASAP